MRWPLLPLVLLACAPSADVVPLSSARTLRRPPAGPSLAPILLYDLRSGAFPASGHPDVAVHVPPGFDASRRPGVVLYLHGWQGCVEAALGDVEIPCTEGGDPRPPGALATQLDESGANAVLVAVELRMDRPSGEPGRLAMPGAGRALLRELFTEHLSEAFGFPLEVDALDRVVIIAHSGGYQAAAALLRFGDLPRVSEIVLLDALYGGDASFLDFVRGGISAFDPRSPTLRRFVDLYTCCGGTVERSDAMRAAASEAFSAAGWPGALYASNVDGDLDPAALNHPIVFKRVAQSHSELPRRYVATLLRAAGFSTTGRASQDAW